MIYTTFEQLQQIYPALTIADVSPFGGTIALQDDSNGLGMYIKTWNYSQPEPTQEQVNALGT